MGLLDALFNSDTYGGQGGGLLDLIRSTQMQNDQYQPNQPSAGFPPIAPPATFADRFNALPNAPPAFTTSGRQFDNAQFDPSTYAPNQAQPIAVGNYQMPRIGNAQQFAGPDPAALPPSAQPTQGGPLPAMQPPAADISAQSRQPQAEPMPLPPALGGTSVLGRIGSPDGLIARLTGNDSRTIAQQNLQAQFQAIRQTLQANGDNPQTAASKAMIAVMNPEAARTILPELFTNKEHLQVLKDGFGNEVPYWANDREQTLHPALGAGGPGATAGAAGDVQGMVDRISQKAAAGAGRQELLQEVPSMYRGYVDGVLTGKALPANMGRAAVRAPIMALAHAVDSNFDESTIPLRFKTQTDYAPNGQSGRSIVALNTVQHHIGKLSDDLENLGDTGWTALNYVRNGIATNTPFDPKQGKAVQSVQDDLKAVTDEMSAAYKAGKVSDHEIEAWQKLASSNLPLRQLKQGIADFVDLLNGKRDQLNDTHKQIIGTEAPGINKDLNETISKKVHDRNAGVSNQNSSKPQTVTQNGHVYNLQPDGSYK